MSLQVEVEDLGVGMASSNRESQHPGALRFAGVGIPWVRSKSRSEASTRTFLSRNSFSKKGWVYKIKGKFDICMHVHGYTESVDILLGHSQVQSTPLLVSKTGREGSGLSPPIRWPCCPQGP